MDGFQWTGQHCGWNCVTRHLLEIKKRIHPLLGTNALASAVPPWLGCRLNKNSPVIALGEISQPHSFRYGGKPAIPFTLITVAIPARGTGKKIVLPATRRSIRRRCTGRLSPHLAALCTASTALTRPRQRF